MGAVQHAQYELDRLLTGDPEEDEMQIEMNKCIMDVVNVFANQGHSGFSAAYAIGIIEKLLRHEPLGPLTGEDGEWVDLSEYGDDYTKYQNRRCSHVFKTADGRAYDIYGKVFVEPNGVSYTSRAGNVDVTFPYVPKTEYVNVDYEGNVIDG